VTPPRQGRLVLVATPIGNLHDVSERMVDALRTSDVIACEDTRRTGRLLQHLGLESRRMLVVNEHTETNQTATVVDLIAAGSTVALVSDAGTPGLSDPGERLVRAVVEAGGEVAVVPGPSAAISALVVSGLPTGRFVFEGFLPRKGAGRSERISVVGADPRTVVLYEAPHRLARTLADLASVCGSERPVVLARELTKLHEELWRGTLGEAVAHAAAVEPRGEYVIVLAGAAEGPPPGEASIDDALRAALASGLSRRDAVDQVATTSGVPRRTVYTRALALGDGTA
jgi:16S rRNA (cytidine1402-2'-O)-methyltransferase